MSVTMRLVLGILTALACWPSHLRYREGEHFETRNWLHSL